MKVDLHLDSNVLMQQTGAITPHLAIHLNNGKTKATYGFMGGLWGWHRFNIKVENGYFLDGKLFYNKREVIEGNKTIVFIVQPRNNYNYIDTFKIKIPKPVAVKVAHIPYSKLAPNMPIQMTLEAVFDNGKRVSTNRYKEHFLWKLFKLEHEGKTKDNNIIWIKSKAPKIIDEALIKAVYQYDSCVTYTAKIPMDYRAKYTFNFNGRRGKRGYNGSDGSGCRNSSGDGDHGSEGGNGRRGKNGQELKVYCDVVYKNNMGHLVVKILGETHKEFAIVNADGGAIFISSKGGIGGRGGTGGDGADGRDEDGNDAAGLGGDGGDGGTGGKGGIGGTISIFTTNAAAPYLSLITIDNSGGEGGAGGYGGDAGRGGTVVDEDGRCSRESSGSGGYSASDGDRGQNGSRAKITILPDEKIKKVMGLD